MVTQRWNTKAAHNLVNNRTSVVTLRNRFCHWQPRNAFSWLCKSKVRCNLHLMVDNINEDLQSFRFQDGALIN